MDPLRLIIEDFMGHRYSDIDCTQFRSALIVGKCRNNPHESNGVGKTTIYHAIDYVLFGEYPTKTIDKIIRSGCDKCRVILEFSTPLGTFKVTRSRNKKSGKSDVSLEELKNGVWTAASHKTSSETEQEIIKKLVRMGYKAFRNSVLFAQSDLNGLTSLASESPEKRRNILKEALNLLDYSKLEKIAKDENTELGKEITNVNVKILSLGTPLTDIKTLKQQIIDTEKTIVEKQSEQLQITSQIDNKKGQLLELQQLLNSDATVIHNKLQEIRENKKKINAQLNQNNTFLSEKERSIKNLSQEMNSYQKEYELLAQQLTNLKNKELRAQEQIQEDIVKLNNIETKGIGYITSLESELIRLNKPLPEGDVCPHCRQPVTPEHRRQCVQDIADAKAKAHSELEISRKKIVNLKAKKVLYEDELKTFTVTNQQIQTIENKILSKQTQIKHQRDHIKNINDLLIQANEDKNINLQKIEEIKLIESSLEEAAQQSSINDLSQKISIVHVEISSLEKQLHSILSEVSSKQTYIEVYKQKLEIREQDNIKLQQYQSELSVLERQFKIWQMVIQAFSAGGIPAMIIYSILDDLQIEANKLLSDLRPGFELQFSLIKNKDNGSQEETLDILYRLNGTELDYEQLSGGQKLMISLSLKLGLSLVIQNRLGVDIKFLELDEVDQPLDHAGVDAFAEIIKKWQNKFKIFVITHNDWLKDKFSHAILVENDLVNGATAKVVSSW